ncbi:hypothetical protein E2562_020013 [Oryza meyeriana var. granulata]|uniref:Uncharacterized protein n=1 Tax=Oryza meyeriana var. granulata TaxID=110450 RepID=A0A6G1FAF6_9ORYZ|nr:hypothetical protein E2562_020013 [Oryza meyeriana var. granulata]
MAAPLKKATNHLGHALPGITTTSPNYAMAAPLQPRPQPQPAPILTPLSSRHRRSFSTNPPSTLPVHPSREGEQ